MSRSYRDLLHAIQTGITFEMEKGSKDTTPKHLRVGVNSALCDQAALVRLLIKKGVFTKEEYEEEILLELEREVKRYEDRILKNYDVIVHLA